MTEDLDNIASDIFSVYVCSRVYAATNIEVNLCY